MTVGDSSVSEPKPFVSTCHWLPSDLPQEVAYTRAFLWAPEMFIAAVSPELGALKVSERVVSRDGTCWRRFELPHGRAEDLNAFEIELTSPEDRVQISVAAQSSLPSRAVLEEVALLQSRGEDDEADDLLDSKGFDGAAINGIGILNLIDRHADLMYRLGQNESSHGPYAEYDFNGNYVRPTLRICNRWESIGRSRTPPLSLIVRLAKELPKTLENVCETPRVVLRRVRELEQAARIREVDQTCIRWLGRQPGRSLIQKAGNRQRLMAVVRKEDCDTPENRVVRDLLVRCRVAGRAYLARNTGFRNHARIKDVQRLVALCEKYLRQSQLANVGKLVGIAKPNYVLQHESRYRILWEAYLRLVRQEHVTQSVWQWRDRVWLEWLTLGLMSGLRRCSFRSPAHRQGVVLSNEPTTGEFIRCSTFGPWWPSQGTTGSPFLVKGADVGASPLPDWVRQLQPDIGIVAEQGNVAIWTVLDVVRPSRTAETIAEHLSTSGLSKGADDCKLVVIVGGGETIQRGEVDGVDWISLPLMFQDSLKTWVSIISEYISNV